MALALPWYADPEVLDLSENASAPYDEATVAGMYRYFLERGEAYIIEIQKAPGAWEPVGDVALTPETVPIVIGVPEVRGRGVGKRVLRLVIERAKALGWKKLKTKGIWTKNLRSRRVFEAVGFKLVRTGPDNESRESWFHELEI